MNLMSRRQKKIDRLVDELTGGEVAIAGFDFERSDATISKNQIYASGDFLDLGEVDLLVKFDKKCESKNWAYLLITLILTGI